MFELSPVLRKAHETVNKACTETEDDSLLCGMTYDEQENGQNTLKNHVWQNPKDFCAGKN